MKDHLKVACAVFVGMVLSVIALYTLYIVYTDHVAVQNIAAYLTSQNATLAK